MMESLDLELEFNVLCPNSYFESGFDSPIQMDEVGERTIERSNLKPEKIKREISRLVEPYQPVNDSAKAGEASRTDWLRSLLTRFTKCPNEVTFDTDFNDGEVRVLLALNGLDWNEKGWSEYNEETMAGLIGKKVRQFVIF